MKTLLLLRHAKSSWADPALPDSARPLNKRGREAASRMGRFLFEEGLTPDLVKCSPSRRTRETVKRVLKKLEFRPQVQFDDALYSFGGYTSYLDTIRQTPETVSTLMLVGHNPSTEMLAAHLSGSGPLELREKMSEKFPTCALAVLSFPPMPWTEVGAERGRLERFVLPREFSP